MPARNSLSPVLDKVDLLVAEISQLRTAGPHFCIVHRFRIPGSRCLPGEEVFSVFLVYREREYHLRLSLALRILFDFLARHSRFPQSARQIELGIRADEFYKRHARNATGQAAITRRIAHSTVRVLTERLKRALSLAFNEANLPIDPDKVLVSEKTVGIEVLIQLKARCTWVHYDLA